MRGEGLDQLPGQQKELGFIGLIGVYRASGAWGFQGLGGLGFRVYRGLGFGVKRGLGFRV